MSDLPCRNSSCKSYGKPHPNCHCYGDMAKGGDVGYFCSKKQDHKTGCAYYAEGGETQSDPNVDVATELSGASGDQKPTQVEAQAPSPQVQEPSWDETAPAGEQATPAWDNTAPPAQDLEAPSAEPEWDNTAPTTASEYEINTATEPEKEEPTWEDTLGKYDTLPQSLATAAEGLAQGFAGPLATYAEQKLSEFGVPHISDADIVGRQLANPWWHGAGELTGMAAGLTTGVGEAALANKAAALLPKVMDLGKVGSKVLQGFVSNAVIAAGDEASKAMLGMGDPEHPVANALANIGIGGLLGGIFEGGAAKLAASDTKMGSKALSWLAGLGAKGDRTTVAATESELNLLKRGFLDEKAFSRGAADYERMLKGATQAIGASIAATPLAGDVTGGIIAFPFIHSLVTNYIKGPVKTAGDLVVPVATKWMVEGAPSNLAPLLNYATQVNQGNALINKSIESLFKEGVKQVPRYLDSEKARDRLEKWIDDTGIDQDIQTEMSNQNSVPQFAEGGAVTGMTPTPKPQSSMLNDNPIAQIYPDQNAMIQTAKGRISNYLRGLKPAGDVSRLPFDPEPDQRKRKRTYQRALTIALDPLSIMGHVRNGTLEPEHVQHFTAMYPELGRTLQNRLTSQIVNSQLSGKKPNFAVRQGLSLLLGTPLSSELLPQNIQAAQATFRRLSQNQSQTQQGAQTAQKRPSRSRLSKTDQAFLTGTQALATRQQQRR